MIIGRTEPMRWNSMRTIREAFGLPTDNDSLPEFLSFWGSLTQEELTQMRHMDLDYLKDGAIDA